MRIATPKIFLTLILLTISISTPPKASAQSLSLGITPPLLEIQIKPGAQYSHTFKLDNLSESTLIFTPTLSFFVPDGIGGNTKPIPTTSSITQNTLNWFTITDNKVNLNEPFTLNSLSSQNINLQITVPNDAIQKDYYLTLSFETEPSALNPNGPKAKAIVGTNVLLTVNASDHPQKKAQITTFSTPKFIDSTKKTIPIDIVLKNTGDSFFKPIGKITITSLFDKEELLLIAPQNVLTNSSRKLLCITNEAQLIPCEFSRKVFIGPYHFKLEFTTNPSGASYTARSTTFALPISIIITILTITIIMFLIYSRRFSEPS